MIVVGSVGSGKSSLLAALLGEMAALRGSVVVRGTAAFTQQDSWIQASRGEWLAGDAACCAVGPQASRLRQPSCTHH